jgi:HK97 family phage major capsid protein
MADEKPDVLEVIHKEDKPVDIEATVLKALEVYEMRRQKEAKEAEELSRLIEERADEIAEEKLKEKEAELEAFARQKGAPLFMKEATPGSGGTPEGGPVDAFRYWCRTGDPYAAKALTSAGPNQKHYGDSWLNSLSEEERKTVTGQSGTGTYLVPDDFVNSITEKRDAISFVRDMGPRIFNTSLPVIDIPAENSSNILFVRAAEAGAYTTDKVEFAQNQVTVHKWTGRTTVTEEFLEDDATNWDDFFVRYQARSMAATEAYYVAVGTGTNQHEGIMEGGTTNSLTFDTTSNITPDEIYELFMKLNTGYQGQAVWLMDNQTWRYLVTLRDTNNWAFGAADYLTINTDGKPYIGTLYGHKVYVQDDIDAIASAKTTIMVGDPWYYALVERKGLAISRNPYLQQANGLVDFFTHFRQGGKVTIASAWAGGIQA